MYIIICNDQWTYSSCCACYRMSLHDSQLLRNCNSVFSYGAMQRQAVIECHMCWSTEMLILVLQELNIYLEYIVSKHSIHTDTSSLQCFHIYLTNTFICTYISYQIYDSSSSTHISSWRSQLETPTHLHLYWLRIYNTECCFCTPATACKPYIAQYLPEHAIRVVEYVVVLTTATIMIRKILTVYKVAALSTPAEEMWVVFFDQIKL
jgi:hypothetical protein